MCHSKKYLVIQRAERTENEINLLYSEKAAEHGYKNVNSTTWMVKAFITNSEGLDSFPFGEQSPPFNGPATSAIILYI